MHTYVPICGYLYRSLVHSGVKIRGLQGWTVHRCPIYPPPFWPASLRLKIQVLFVQKKTLSEKFPFRKEKAYLNMNKVPCYCKKKSALLLEKVPFVWKKCPFARKECSFSTCPPLTVTLISYIHPCPLRSVL